jgi:hypothetical protein
VAKWQGYETGHPLPSNAEIKNGGAIPPLPHTFSWRSVKLSKHRDYLYLLHYSALVICGYCHLPLIDIIGFMKHCRLAIHWLTNPVLTTALLFIVGTIISLILFKKLQNMSKSSEH